MAGEVVGETAAPYLAAASDTLARAFELLAHPDRSGARIEGLPLEGARYEIRDSVAGAGAHGRAARPARRAATALVRPAPGSAPAPGTEAETDADADADRGPDPRAQRTTPATGAGRAAGAAPGESGPEDAAHAAVWTPMVDDDMLELFFTEANERIEALAIKLVDVEGRPGDAELLRDVFRDLHTFKGSSSMVGLVPMKNLAHAAEDLVGQVREGTRQADRAVIDALLAALDRLRDIGERASRREPIPQDAPELVRRLRDPHAAIAAPAAPPAAPGDRDDEEPPPGAGDGAGPAPTARHAAASHRHQTIRVDFDKLDQLLNLVGELVLGRDALHSSLTSLGSLGIELGQNRQLARRLEQAAAGAGPGPGPGAITPIHRAAPSGPAALADLRDELGRIERVLTAVSQELDHSTGRLDAISGELREAVMRLRMVPVGGVVRKHHRTVRDLANALGKRARVTTSGEDTELDKLLVEALDEPLLHLVRNAVDHGLEPPDQRAAAGKPPEGTVHIGAAQRGNQVIIEVSDDGRGIDPELVRRKVRERDLVSADELAAMDDRAVLDLIFRPGFSTAQVVSDVSGRGVGMDVVRQTIVRRLKGQIEIRSQVGAGSRFVLSLPLTLAIAQVLLARAGGEVFAVPLDNVVRTLTTAPTAIHRIQDREVLTVRGRQVPLIRVSQVLELGDDGPAGDSLHVILTELGAETYGLVVDALLGKKEIVIKSLGDLLRGVPCAAGATLLGDRCALILDVPAMIARALDRRGRIGIAVTGARASASPSPGAGGPPAVLLVEDSDTTRESLRRLLSERGYRVTVARDGVEGLELAQAASPRFDLVFDRRDDAAHGRLRAHPGAARHRRLPRRADHHGDQPRRAHRSSPRLRRRG